MLTLTHESTIKLLVSRTIQTDNSRLNTMINANYPQESSHSVLNENLRFSHHEHNLYFKYQLSLMEVNK